MPCVSAAGVLGTQTATQVLTLEPTIQGVLHGAMMVTVESGECGQRGAEIQVPVVATRTSDLPEGIQLPDPAAVAPPSTGAPAPSPAPASGPAPAPA